MEEYREDHPTAIFEEEIAKALTASDLQQSKTDEKIIILGEILEIDILFFTTTEPEFFVYPCAWEYDPIFKVRNRFSIISKLRGGLFEGLLRREKNATLSKKIPWLPYFLEVFGNNETAREWLDFKEIVRKEDKESTYYKGIDTIM